MTSPTETRYAWARRKQVVNRLAHLMRLPLDRVRMAECNDSIDYHEWTLKEAADASPLCGRCAERAR